VAEAIIANSPIGTAAAIPAIMPVSIACSTPASLVVLPSWAIRHCLQKGDHDLWR
jgi:hypothetical protein